MTRTRRPTFAPWYLPWRWCRARNAGCRLTRRHYGRHARFDGFDVQWFDTAREGTP